MSNPTTLYRLFDSEGELLYVGIAGNPGRRFEQHKEDKPWWGDVANVRLEHFETRHEAADAERVAIQSEMPRHNKTHRRELTTAERMVAEALDASAEQWGGTGRWRQAVDIARLVVAALPPVIESGSDAVHWACEGCGGRIRGRDGYLEVDLQAADAHGEAWKRFTAAHSGNGYVAIQGPAWQDFFDLPPRASWMAWHRECDPDPDSSSYFIEIGRLSNTWQIIEWTAHLSEKYWLADTDWQDVLQRIASSVNATGVPA